MMIMVMIMMMMVKRRRSEKEEEEEEGSLQRRRSLRRAYECFFSGKRQGVTLGVTFTSEKCLIGRRATT